MIRTHFGQHDASCFGCKLVSIQFGRSTFEPHFNYAVGRYVSSQQEFESALSRLSDANSERTGITHNYEPLHPSDIVNNPPPESPPNHLAALSDGVDPTLPNRVESRVQERQKAHHTADEQAKTTDLINV